MTKENGSRSLWLEQTVKRGVAREKGRQRHQQKPQLLSELAFVALSPVVVI